MIHVCYALRDTSGKYSKFVGTSIESLLENTREDVTIHVIHDSTLTSENRKKLTIIVYRFNQEIEFHRVDESRFECARQIQVIHQEPNRIAQIYRLLIPEILDSPRVIYLDADTIVNLDISELWSIDLEDKPIATVTEFSAGAKGDAVKMWQTVRMGFVRPEDQFNTGVLVMDSNKISSSGGGGQNFLQDCVSILLEHPNFWLLDQDALNFIFRENFLKLPPRFNRMLGWYKPEKIEREIYHFVLKTLTLDTRDRFSRLWFEYFLRTPFATPDSFGNLFAAISTPARQKIDLIRKLKDRVEKNSDCVIRIGSLDFKISPVTNQTIIKREDFFDLNSLLESESLDACELLKKI